MTELFLRPRADHRLRGGHLWVYANEIDTSRSPLTAFEPGDPVVLRDAGGRPLGCAYMDPHALICARLYAPGEQRPLDEAFFSERLQAALAFRNVHFARPFYRLVYGDSDGLPGVVIDRFDDYLVLQLNNPGLERHLPPLLAALDAVFSPRGVLLRRDSRSRREQGEAADAESVLGSVPETVAVEENGVSLLAPVVHGQKTGWFYDHRESRARLADWAVGGSVLDVYSYVGGWGVQAAARGAVQLCCVDSSAAALAGAVENARVNGVDDRVETRRGSAPEVLAALLDEGRQFDAVVIDPPAFIQRRKEQHKGIAAYRRINEAGLRLLRPGGLLVSASCSMQLARADHIRAVQQAAVRTGCELRIVAQGGQGPDHPVHPAIPETEYLKTLFARRLR